MEELRGFYRDLNLTVGGPEVRELWSEYRKAVTEFAVDGMQRNGSVVVIGAGNMNDLDYRTILEASEDITFADVDLDSMRANLPAEAKLEFVDFGCIEFPSGHLTEHEATKILVCAEPCIKSTIGKRSFGNILISPFYTQILLPWLFARFDGIDSDSRLLSEAMGLCARIIKQANDYIQSIAAKGAYVCLWTDFLEYSTQDPVLKDIVLNIDDNEWLDAFIEQYIDRFGHGTGSYGHMDMENTLDNPKHRWLLWPFSPDRTMIVRIASGIISE